eukprot:Pompholyxophrys_punicea_v1_NODE_8_length_8388_cov_12.748020.p5 type:complete len:154 gc:universal NODE_8_length_8388_cov_12.748020:67-528(+)
MDYLGSKTHSKLLKNTILTHPNEDIFKVYSTIEQERYCDGLLDFLLESSLARNALFNSYRGAQVSKEIWDEVHSFLAEEVERQKREEDERDWHAEAERERDFYIHIYGPSGEPPEDEFAGAMFAINENDDDLDFDWSVLATNNGSSAVSVPSQ